MRASLRVTKSSENDDYPDRSQMELAASALRKFGLEVVYIGSSTVNVVADARVLADVLGFTPIGAEGGSCQPEPSDSLLRQLIDWVEAYPRIRHLAR